MKLKKRGRPKTINQQHIAIANANQIANVILDLDDKLLLEYQIKHCSVKLTPINIENSAMDETSSTPPVAPKRRGRKPKHLLAAKNVETPSKTDASDANQTIDDKNESNANDGIAKAEKPEKLSLSERKQAKKAQIEAIIASGGRGKRTPKPNPKYMDEPVASASKYAKDEHDLENEIEGEDGDDEMNLSSDDQPRNEGPLKKRMLQKVGIKPGPGRKPGSGKGTPGRKPIGATGFKRKLEIDIDIDDEHGKQLFLDAKRRFNHSPSGSEDDAQLKKSKSPVADALAAKLRAKYPNDFAVKRVGDNKVSPINRARLLERNKIVQKGDGIELRNRKQTDETETSEDDFGPGKGASDQDGSPKNINRRKTQHTKILSDDKIIRPSSSTSSGTTTTILRRTIGGTTVVTKQINKSPLAQNQLIHSKQLCATAAKTYSISSQSRIIGSNKPAILRQPPRILNSTLCKPTNKATVPSLVTKVVTKDDYEHELNKKRNNNIISSRSKENNVTSYVYTEKDGKMIPKKQVVQLSPQQKLIQQRKTALPVVRTPSTQQRIISEPVTMNIPNSRRIRKITCFETWYVIKMADEQPKVEKSLLSLTLMQIGNEIKKIELPSSEWTYKILLQPLSKELLAMRKTKADEIKSKAIEEKKSTDDENAEQKNDSENKTDTIKSKSIDIKIEEKKEKKLKRGRKVDENKDNIKKDKTEESADAPKDDEKKDKNEKTTKSDDAKEDEKEKKSEEKTDDEKDIKEEVKSEDSSESKPSEISTEEEEEKKPKSEETETEEKPTVTEDETNKVHDVYTGEVHDPNINPDERQNYRPINIMFRRKCQNPNIRIQYDRTVIFKNQTFYLNVDGKNVRLTASPQQIDTYDDIQTLLQIVDDISLKSCCVELATHIG